MKCPSCEKTVAHGAMFCPHCGGVLGGEFCPTCGQAMPGTEVSGHWFDRIVIFGLILIIAGFAAFSYFRQTDLSAVKKQVETGIQARYATAKEMVQPLAPATRYQTIDEKNATVGGVTMLQIAAAVSATAPRQELISIAREIIASKTNLDGTTIVTLYSGAAIVKNAADPANDPLFLARFIAPRVGDPLPSGFAEVETGLLVSWKK
jgi:hypothetical protein